MHTAFAVCLLLLAGCGLSAKEAYELEVLKLEAMQQEASELVRKIYAEASMLMDKNNRELEIATIESSVGVAADHQKLNRNTDEAIDAYKRANKSPLWNDLKELSKRIEAQKQQVAEARHALTQ
ncbi:hypothetical protein [Lacipirellula sp.]|uniref:hypothetical protein n=1 Tax=Lacipirellula sp. TaxID=2691419 RepID=UPI003D0D0A16